MRPMQFIAIAMILLAAFTFLVVPMADVDDTTGDTTFPAWFVDSNARLLLIFIFAGAAVFALIKVF